MPRASARRENAPGVQFIGNCADAPGDKPVSAALLFENGGRPPTTAALASLRVRRPSRPRRLSLRLLMKTPRLHDHRAL
jgi:hypothetical protein